MRFSTLVEGLVTICAVVAAVPIEEDSTPGIDRAINYAGTAWYVGGGYTHMAIPGCFRTPKVISSLSVIRKHTCYIYPNDNCKGASIGVTGPGYKDHLENVHMIHYQCFDNRLSDVSAGILEHPTIEPLVGSEANAELEESAGKRSNIEARPIELSANDISVKQFRFDDPTGDGSSEFDLHLNDYPVTGFDDNAQDQRLCGTVTTSNGIGYTLNPGLGQCHKSDPMHLVNYVVELWCTCFFFHEGCIYQQGWFSISGPRRGAMGNLDIHGYFCYVDAAGAVAARSLALSRTEAKHITSVRMAETPSSEPANDELRANLFRSDDLAEFELLFHDTSATESDINSQGASCGTITDGDRNVHALTDEAYTCHKFDTYLTDYKVGPRCLCIFYQRILDMGTYSSIKASVEVRNFGLLLVGYSPPLRDNDTADYK
ncbi:hypothetical protein K505DRAFT_331327 [Melanomma pulvis-pyrius CBS 109.77]|uniref:Uncharacterized protein n=1 Tax=Melanomma pulvis-pyrius CBS 109.77 TaxID=1314802 RepID=A0A6A6XWV2_9PLEO|nr:hypothetical protein K505DRAFT_331327 [Melanomma pulvis-pyrius CBS 109.77]